VDTAGQLVMVQYLQALPNAAANWTTVGDVIEKMHSWGYGMHLLQDEGTGVYEAGWFTRESDLLVTGYSFSAPLAVCKATLQVLAPEGDHKGE
jgi:hypothetical protein